MTDEEVAFIMETPKRIGERLRWRASKDDRPGRRELLASVFPMHQEDFDRELYLFGDCYRSRSGVFNWAVGLRANGMRKPLVRIDRHANPHRNPDGTLITGCMMHLWSEATRDRVAVAAHELIDCSHVQAALITFMEYAKIELLGTYEMTMGFDYGVL